MFERAVLSSKRHFYYTTSCSLKPKSLKKQLFFNSKCHMGGGEGVRKLPKKCHLLFEWPLKGLKIKCNYKSETIFSPRLRCRLTIWSSSDSIREKFKFIAESMKPERRVRNPVCYFEIRLGIILLQNLCNNKSEWCSFFFDEWHFQSITLTQDSVFGSLD